MVWIFFKAKSSRVESSSFYPSLQLFSIPAIHSKHLMQYLEWGLEEVFVVFPPIKCWSFILQPEPKRAFEGAESGDKCESVDMFQDQMAFHYFGICESKRGDATMARRQKNDQPFGIATFHSDLILDFTLGLVSFLSPSLSSLWNMKS